MTTIVCAGMCLGDVAHSDSNGFASKARIPVNEKSNGPITLKALQFFSDFISSGTLSSEQTIDNSSSVLLIEKNVPSVAQEGIRALVSKRQTANLSGIIESESFEFSIV